MKKLLVSMLVLGISSAFAASTTVDTAAMNACMKKGGTQAECQNAGKAASKAKSAATNDASSK